MADNKIVPANEGDRATISSVFKECVSSDIRGIGYDVLVDTVIPGGLDLLHQAIVSVLDRTLHPYGQNRGYSSNYIRMQRYGQPATRAEQYHQSYGSSSMKKDYAKQQKEQKEMDRIEMVYVWPFYIEGKAVADLEELKERIKLHGKVTVAEFYDICTDQLPQSPDWDWGWVNLDSARIIKGRDGNGNSCFFINLPRVIGFNNPKR